MSGEDGYDVLLVDVLTGGHHYEYAGEVCSRLDDRGHDVDFLGPAPTDRYEELLGSDASFLFDEGEAFPDRLDDDPDAARTEAVGRLYSQPLGAYDVVHFLAADTLVEHLVREYEGRSLPAIVLSLNGSFFRHVPFGDAPLTVASDWLFETLGGHWYPVRNNRPTLSRALGEGPADHVTAPTVPAVKRLHSAFDQNRAERVTLAPDPAVPWRGRLPGPQTAREDLGIPGDQPVVLYFGQMRAEKGVELLVEALDRYEGEPVTAVLAGSPTDVDGELLQSVGNDRIETVVDDEFVPQERVPAYFGAADVVVFPYRRSFGRARPSGVFQKACAAHRPTVVPEFGVFERTVTEYGVGVTFEPGDPDSLAEQLGSVVADTESVTETAKFAEYCRVHSYDHLVSQFESVYKRVTADGQ